MRRGEAAGFFPDAAARCAAAGACFGVAGFLATLAVCLRSMAASFAARAITLREFHR